MMRRIARETEKQYLADRWQYLEGRFQAGARHGGRAGAGVPAGAEFLVEGLHPITQAVVDGASRIAAELDAKLVRRGQPQRRDGDRPVEAARGRADRRPLRRPRVAAADGACTGA